MAEPNNTPWPPATPQSQSPLSASPVLRPHPGGQVEPKTAASQASAATKNGTHKLRVLHIGDPIKYNPETYAAFSAQCDIIRPSTPERQRPAFAAALRDGKWGDFSAIFRPFWGTGGEMGTWDAELIPLLPASCRVFASAGAGFDWADTQLLGERGIIYCNSGLAAAEAVADFAVALVVSTFRHLPWCTASAPDPSAFQDCHARATAASHTLRGHVLGLVGMGNIGQQIAQRLGVGFGMKVHYFDVVRKDPITVEAKFGATFHETMESLMRVSDCVVLCTPAGGKVITAESLAWIKPGSRFVNIARGSLVDEEALADALESGQIGTVALDVHADEPRPHPRLLKMAGTKAMLTCHNAGGTVETHKGFEELSRQTEELRCTCSTIRLDDRPTYNALSYVWGNREAKAQVIVNGVQVNINKSLAGALRRIRHDREPIVIWADALCINQNDEDEKKYQIDLMHRIYGECENCLVWMGDIVVKGDSSVAAELAARAALNALRIIAGQPHDEDLGWPGHITIDDGLRMVAAYLDSQEVCLPPKATVLWGPLEISFQAIMDAASHMVQPDEHPRRNNIVDLFQEGTAMYPRHHTSPYTIPVFSIAQARLWNQSRTDSLYRLWRFRDRRSTYPKDQLFGIWALLDKTYLPDIRPTDYVLDIVVLFSRLMVSLLRSRDNLQPLIGWRGERETAGLPTWVLDLAQPEDSNCTSDFWTHDIAWRQFHASSGLPRFKPLVKQVEDLTLLTLDGIRVDKVATILMDLRHTRQSLWRQGFEDAIKDQAGTDDIMYQYNNLIQGKFGENRERVTDESWHGGPWWEDRMLCYQVLFITQENRLGLGSPNLKPEDNVWILSGGNHPFLLRQVSKRRGNADLWEFVGDCFVYGIMYGEASSGGFQLSSVTLC
ncbi:D-isomer specific 2-hydroxyacid dehydrogenase [Colletotrichum costaricense]|uniref:D-isomer specific 2-hydroxyacid dehydrogenase n=1 Tax=Colletotrichum costaricense TaxID=1209916 RepID=A0AAI9Z8B4_9PEZI|nr:D-isomer specific 2-hydroxyacid dehydrogenase [Colletotrichum costaricense]KAK1538806.1 D-isomer specific 2-hydroxyacid dehydrogenase [Colletotrichum costaricense]